MEGVQGDLKNPTTLATDPSEARLPPTQRLPVETITHILAKGVQERRKWSSMSTLAKAFEANGSDGCWESVRMREEVLRTAPMRSGRWSRVRWLEFRKGQSEVPAAAEAVLKGLILPACPHLTSLNIVVSPYMFSDASPIQHAIPTLRTLSMNIRRTDTHDPTFLLSGLLDFVSAFPNISSLAIRNPDIGGSPLLLHSYVHAVAAFPHLNKVLLVGLPVNEGELGSSWDYDGIPGSLVSFIIAILPRLRHLETLHTESRNPEIGEPFYDLLPTSTTHALLAALSASSSLTTFDTDLCVRTSAIKSGLRLLEGTALKTIRWRLGTERNEKCFKRVNGKWRREE